MHSVRFENGVVVRIESLRLSRIAGRVAIASEFRFIHPFG